MTTKKVFKDVVELLEANKNRKVSSMLEQIYELTKAKTNNKTFHLVDGETEIVYCYYHKQWELVKQTPYGLKASTASGLNTMCKLGVSNWTKQQRSYKKAKDALLLQVAEGSISSEEVGPLLKQLHLDSKLIVAAPEGYDELEDAIIAMSE